MIADKNKSNEIDANLKQQTNSKIKKKSPERQAEALKKNLLRRKAQESK